MEGRPFFAEIASRKYWIISVRNVGEREVKRGGILHFVVEKNVDHKRKKTEQ